MSTVAPRIDDPDGVEELPHVRPQQNHDRIPAFLFGAFAGFIGEVGACVSFIMSIKDGSVRFR